MPILLFQRHQFNVDFVFKQADFGVDLQFEQLRCQNHGENRVYHTKCGFQAEISTLCPLAEGQECIMDPTAVLLAINYIIAQTNVFLSYLMGYFVWEHLFTIKLMQQYLKF